MAKRQTRAEDWPVCDSPLLADIAAAFLHRRKAIAYKTRAQGSFTCSREFSESATETVERLNLDLRGGYLRLSVWADAGMWLSLSVRAPGRNSGWAFQDQFTGDVNDVSGPALVHMIEATLATPLGADPPTERQQLRTIWRRVHPQAA